MKGHVQRGLFIGAHLRHLRIITLRFTPCANSGRELSPFGDVMAGAGQHDQVAVAPIAVVVQVVGEIAGDGLEAVLRADQRPGPGRRRIDVAARFDGQGNRRA